MTGNSARGRRSCRFSGNVLQLHCADGCTALDLYQSHRHGHKWTQICTSNAKKAGNRKQKVLRATHGDSAPSCVWAPWRKQRPQFSWRLEGGFHTQLAGGDMQHLCNGGQAIRGLPTVTVFESRHRGQTLLGEATLNCSTSLYLGILTYETVVNHRS